MGFLQTIRRPSKRGGGNGIAREIVTPIRLSGTNTDTETRYERDPKEPGLGNDNPNGRTGNDWTYPDYPRGRFDVSEVNGDRLQDQTGRHIHEGEAPGRIPRQWNNRVIGKVGGISGSVSGEIHPGITITGDAAGGIEDMMYVPHTPTPRTITPSRPYLRTVDDAAQVPGIFLSDPTRH